MSSQVQFLLEAEEAQAVQAFLKVVDAQKQTEQQTTRVTKANRDLERAAVKVFESTRTPAEQHVGRMRELKKMLDANKISQDTFNRAVDESRQKYRQATGEIDRQKQAAKEAAEAQKQAAKETAEAQKKAAEDVAAAQKKLGDAAKRVFDSTRTPLERHKQQMSELNRLVTSGSIDQETYRRAVDRTNQELQESQVAGKQAYGSQALSQLKGMAAGVLSIAAAWSAARSVFQAYRQEQDDAAQRDRQSRRGLASLAQLADNQGEFDTLTGAAREMFAKGGAASEDEAGRTIFTLKSAGLFDQRQTFTEMMSSGLIDAPDEFAAAIAQLSNSMGRGETGSVRDIINKAIGASGGALANVPELLSGAARAGTGASVLGISDEEVLAAVTAVSGSTGSAERAGTQVAALLKSLDKLGGFEGKGLMQSVDEISAQNLDGAGLNKLLGEQEAVNAYRLLAGGDSRELYTSAMGDMNRALRTDALGRRLNLAEGDDALAAARRADVSENAMLAAQQGESGVTTNLMDTLRNRQVQLQIESGEQGPLARGVTGAAQATTRFFGGDAFLLRQAYEGSLQPDENPGVTSPADVLRADPDLQRRAAEALGESAKELKDAAAEMRRANQAAARRPSTIATNQGE